MNVLKMPWTSWLPLIISSGCDSRSSWGTAPSLLRVPLSLAPPAPCFHPSPGHIPCCKNKKSKQLFYITKEGRNFMDGCVKAQACLALVFFFRPGFRACLMCHSHASPGHFPQHLESSWYDFSNSYLHSHSPCSFQASLSVVLVLLMGTGWLSLWSTWIGTSLWMLLTLNASSGFVCSAFKSINQKFDRQLEEDHKSVFMC